MKSSKLDELMTPLVKRSQKRERSFVDAPQRARRLMLRDAILAVLALAVVMTHDLADSWLGTLLSIIFGGLVGVGLMSATRRAMSYRSGWLDGRMAFVNSLSEAMRRDMTPDEWLAAELARDYAVMGFPAQPPPPDNGGAHDDLSDEL